MKKVFLSLALSFMSICSFSQVKVSFDYPDVEVQFKRCVLKGNIAYLDFLMTNNTKEEIIARPRDSYGNDHLSAYDDEGNVYLYELSSDSPKIWIQSFAGKTINSISFSAVDIIVPVGIPVKGRIQIFDVDEFSTLFNLVKIPFWPFYGKSQNKNNSATIQFKNVPIIRQ